MKLSVTVAFASLLLTSVSALPNPAGKDKTRQKKGPLPKCLDIRDATPEFFMKNRKMIPPRDSILLYTWRTKEGTIESLAPTARALAAAEHLTSIWDIWPNKKDVEDGTFESDFYDMDGPQSRLRCIKAKKQQQTYWENMSAATALSGIGTVYVMTDDPSGLPDAGIWYNVEVPTLMKNERVGKVEAITVTGRRFKTVIDRPEMHRAKKNNAQKEKMKKGHHHDTWKKQNPNRLADGRGTLSEGLEMQPEDGEPEDNDSEVPVQHETETQLRKGDSKKEEEDEAWLGEGKWSEMEGNPDDGLAIDSLA